MTTLPKTLAATVAICAISAFSLSPAQAASPKINVSQQSTPALRAWGKAIGKVLKKEMGYPKNFETAGEYGTVSYLLTVNRVGDVLEFERIQSSGYTRLDESAAETIAAMQMLPAMPDTLKAQAAQVEIRMAYLPLKRSGFPRPTHRLPKTDTYDLTNQTTNPASGLKITLLDTAPERHTPAGR